MPSVSSFSGWGCHPRSPPLLGLFVVGQSRDQEVAICPHSTYQSVDNLAKVKARVACKAS